MGKKLKKMLLWIILGYVVILILMFVFQSSLIYIPDKTLKAPHAYGLENVETLTLTTADNTAITAWYMAAKQGYPTLIHLHGNAGNLGDRQEVYRDYNAAGFGILAVEWRGYGSSEGSPTEAGLYDDARTALAYARTQLGLADDQIALYGESLGTAVAVQIAKENPSLLATILEAPPESVWKRGAEIHWWLPVKYLMHDRYDTIEKIASINMPLLIIHNTKDRIVPIHHGKALYAAASQPKELAIYDYDGHVYFDRKLIAQKIKDFLQAHTDKSWNQLPQ